MQQTDLLRDDEMRGKMVKKKKLRKRVYRIAGIILLIAVLLFAVWKTRFDPYRGTSDTDAASLPLDKMLTKEQVLEDMDYLYDKLRTRHPAWINGDDAVKDAAESEYRRQRSSVGDEMSVLDLWRSCRYILAAMNDGHTYLDWIGDSSPVIDDFTDLESGDTLTAINHEDAEAVYQRFVRLNSSETEATDRTDFRNRVPYQTELELMEVDVSDGVTFTFRKSDGTEYDRHYSFVDSQDAVQLPERLRGSTEALTWHIDEERGIGYFDLNRCDYDSTYLRMTNEFFDAVKEKECGTVVVDLRDNPGGNSEVATAFLRHVDVKNYKIPGVYVRYGPILRHYPVRSVRNEPYADPFSGNIYVLTNAATFSSATSFAMYLQDNGIGLVAGEASGNLMDRYGDCLCFTLPNSKLSLSVAHKQWERIDRTKAGQQIEPDLPFDPDTALDYVAGIVANERMGSD